MSENIKYYKIIGFPIRGLRSAISFYKIDFNTRYDSVIRIWNDGYVENEDFSVRIKFLERCTEITKEEYESAIEI
jgi:hypothetical protein